MTIYSDLTLCNPEFAARCTRLHKYLVDAHQTGRTKTRFEIFETFRTPMRQRDLFKKGASEAGPFQSAHQFGLAVDFVPHISPEEAHALYVNIGERVMPGGTGTRPTTTGFSPKARPVSNLPYRLPGTLAMSNTPTGRNWSGIQKNTSNEKGAERPPHQLSFAGLGKPSEVGRRVRLGTEDRELDDAVLRDGVRTRVCE